ncbi:YncE family protein [Candidatus Bipolaricaulota sp. J31]
MGLHRYDPAGFPGAAFLDVADAQYNPLDPGEIIAGIHPAARPGTYGLAKFRDGALTAEAFTPYKWSSCFELYIDAGERLLYTATGTNVVEIRELEGLRLREELTLPVRGITSVALDSRGRLWSISNPMYGGDGGLYVIEDIGHPEKAEKVRRYSVPASLDSLRISPWGRKLLVADHGGHTVECVSEDGDILGTIYFPYVSGVKWTLDERVLISSGKFPRHTFLLLMTGALHNTVESGWFGYLVDYGTQASNRADAFYPDRVLIQWYLGFSEISLPLPKRAPYVIRVGEGEFEEGQPVRAQGFTAFTPILAFNRCHIIARPKDMELALEVMVPHHHLIAPKPEPEWEEVARFKGVLAVEMPGVYRVRARSKGRLEVWAICAP